VNARLTWSSGRFSFAAHSEKVSLNVRGALRAASSVACILIWCAVGVLSIASADSQTPSHTGDSVYVHKLDELDAIEFEGLEETTSEQLIGVIQSRESEVSITRRLALFYWENFKRNPATPYIIMQTLTDVQKELLDELRYFNEQLVRDDSVSLLVYLSQIGYHNAKVDWRAGYDYSRHEFVLTFIVDEGPRAVIDTVIYVGLDSIDASVLQLIAADTVVRKGLPFSEEAFEARCLRILTTLQNNGYYRAAYKTPLVFMSADGLRDSILVEFRVGPRARIRSIIMEENDNGYPSVHESTRRRVLEFNEGEWFSRRKLNQSRFNLMELGVFDIVSIDTMEIEADKGTHDSLIDIKVFSKNSKNYDAGANLTLFQTAVDNYLNLGAGVTGQLLNVFGGAQMASLTLQYILQDISRIFQGQNLESEALASAVFAWPNIARFDGVRVGLNTNTYYSLRILVDPFRLESFGVNTRLKFDLHSFTYFNGFDVTAGIERQIPQNYVDALDSALSNAKSPSDTAYVLSTFNQFLVLDQYLHTTGNFFTGYFLGLNLRGEHRDNRINPSSGTFAAVSGEFGYGAAKFLKGQIFHTSAHRISPSLILATKVKAGHIHLLDFQRGSDIDTNTYVPLERQFFAGGAASIRSYASRLLHDPNSGVIRTSDPNQDRILANVVGSGSLLELGLEFRFRLGRPRGLTGFWASLFERSGITFFLDAGNAFNRLTPDLYGKMTLQDLWKGSVVAFGLGYRFDTPVGPVRFDYATSVYDPLRDTGQVIWNGRQNIMGFSNWNVSIGLGHAF
jgi:outer membrane protein assembly factor BamA